MYKKRRRCYKALWVRIKAVFSLWYSNSSLSDSEFIPPAASSSPHTVGIPRYDTFPWPSPKPNPTRIPPPLEFVTGSLVLLQKGTPATPECSCKRTKTAANVAKMKAQLSTATSAGNFEDSLGSSDVPSEPESPSLFTLWWSMGMLGDFRCTWFWCMQEVTTRWLCGGHERHSSSPGPEHVRQAGWQGRQACTVECSTQLSKDKLRTCGPELKPGGQDFTQPCK